MAMAFSKNDEYTIEAKAWREFGVAPIASGTLGEKRSVRNRRAQISRDVFKGLQILGSDNPPRSRDEAVERIVGVIGMLLQVLFPQYRLTIQVAGWLWDLFHGDPIATASGDLQQ